MMRFLRRALCVLTASVALSAAAPARAAIVSVVYTGTVDYGWDVTGLFGTANGDLAGLSFKMEYVFDTTRGERFNNPYNHVYGGTVFGTISPALSMTATINGTAQGIEAIHFASMDGLSNLNESRIHHQGEYYYSDGLIFKYNYFNSFVQRADGQLPASLEGPYYRFIQAGDFSKSYVYFNTFDYTANAYIIDTFAQMQNETLSITTLSSAVPEPSTWAMMLIGFLGLALVHRRRHAIAPMPDRYALTRALSAATFVASSAAPK